MIGIAADFFISTGARFSAQAQARTYGVPRSYFVTKLRKGAKIPEPTNSW